MSTRSDTALQTAVNAGVAAGLLPANAVTPSDSTRAWPVVLLTAVGAWFAAIPLIIMAGLLLGNLMDNGLAVYVIGCLVSTGTILVLRAKKTPLFVEQLAIPALIVGGGLLAFGLHRDLDDSGGAAVMLLIVVGIALAVPKAWLRVLLGSAAAVLLYRALSLPYWDWERGRWEAMLVLHGLLAGWLLALWLQQRSANLAVVLESTAAGWLLTTLAGFALISGTSFLMGGLSGMEKTGWMFVHSGGNGEHTWQIEAVQSGSSLLALAAGLVGAVTWQGLRQFLFVVVALALAVLAWFMPMLGGTLLALSITATTHRWRQAGACALIAAWIVGGFYYQLQWSLVDKALLLVVAGTVLGACAWQTQRMLRSDLSVIQRTSDAWSWSLAAATLLTLVVANGAIWQKQHLIAHGKPVYMELVPVDPRSLMQGDYMRLRFSALQERSLPLLSDMAGIRPRMVAQLDARGVAKVLRMHIANQPLATNEILLELSPKNGEWTFVTDAWFFKEGEAERWQAAKYGEFRVLPDGRALLVGMADDSLQSIGTR